MAHESFEDAEVARRLNEGYVAVKVDKEERPDIDSIYMSVCQMMNGSGGWPLTVLITPEQKPFFAATYLPKLTRMNYMGLIELLDRAVMKWACARAEIEEFAQRATDMLGTAAEADYCGSETVLVLRAIRALKKAYDEHFGGFGGAPKFPTPHNLLFLMKAYETTNDKSVIGMVENTLEQMYRGGIFDHIGFGFSRYSTDERWLVPHFEKMLYDNALLINAYTEAFRITHKPLYRTVAERIIVYVTRELTNAEGGFYCAQDADSDGVEGKYYLFEPREIIGLLGEKAGEAFNRAYDITEAGNFEGKSIPNLLNDTGDAVKQERYLAAVYEYRRRRTALHTDDKCLCAWNGMMIAALAAAYGELKAPEYLKAAAECAAFIERRLAQGDTLFAGYRDGRRSEYGFLDDYAYYIRGLIELYRVGLDRAYLTRAEELTRRCVSEFHDDAGGFFLYGRSREQLLTRPKEVFDGAIPSGNAVMAYNLFMLSRMLKSEPLERLAAEQRRFMTARTADQPLSAGFFMYVLVNYS